MGLKRRYRFLLLVIAFLLSIWFGNSDRRSQHYNQILKHTEIRKYDTLLAQGKVVHVADADTITVLGSNEKSYRIRLQGIDAPEKKQAFGTQCQHKMREMLQQQRVDVEAHKLDRYQRVVAKVFWRDKDIALEMIRQGCGWHYTAYADEQSWWDQWAYAKAEREAREGEIGLWGDAKPVAPWDYRRQK